MEIPSFLGTNLIGLAATGALGLAAYAVRNVPAEIGRAVRYLFVVSLEVDSDDEAYLWVERWLAAHPSSRRSRSVSVRSRSLDPRVSSSVEEIDGHSPWILTPGSGWHVVWWRGRPVIVSRPSVPGGQESRNTKYRIQFQILGRGQNSLREMVDEIRAMSTAQTLIPIRVWHSYWTRVPGRTPRSLDTLVLRGGQIERVLADLKWFSGAREWYATRGIPYRRGYLFSGVPGTGKTSLVVALAGYLDRPICILNLGSVSGDTALLEAVSSTPVDAILLLEDVDSAVSAQSADARVKRARPESSYDGETLGSPVTRAGILNALDGVSTPEGRIVMMTTNYPERLDAALIRPGRADVHEILDAHGPDEQVRMAERFYGSVPFEPLPRAVTAADMQAAFMRYPDDPLAARAALSAEPRRPAITEEIENER